MGINWGKRENPWILWEKGKNKKSKICRLNYAANSE